MTLTSDPNSPPKIDLKDTLIALALGAFALAVYVFTLCPTIFTDDCGEIATAVVTGGVMHPPGYPLYSLLGRLFVTAIHWGEPAHSLGLLSSVSAAIAVALTYLLSRRLDASRLWAACATVGLAFSYTLWSQATKVETYALNAMFVALMALLAVAYTQTASRRPLFAIALAGGFALTNHLTTIWLIPAALVAILPTLRRVEGRTMPALLAGAVVVTLLPLSLYGYELYAARTHAGGQIWGDTTSLHQLWLHVSGARYHDYFHMSAAARAHRLFVYTPEWLWRNMGIMLPLALFGFAAHVWRRETRLAASVLGVGAVSYVIGNTLYGILNIFEYYTAVVILLAPLAAVGAQALFAWLVGLLEPRGLGRPAVVLQYGVMALIVAAGLVTNWASCDRRAADYMRVLAENTLRPLPDHAVVVSIGDNRTFPLWYVQDVLHERTDVTVVPRQLMDGYNTSRGCNLMGWALQRVAHTHPEVDANALLQQCAANPKYASAEGPFWDIVAQSVARGQQVYFTDPLPGDMTPVQPADPAAARAALARVPGETLVIEGIMRHAIDARRTPSVGESLAVAKADEQRMRLEYAPPALFENEPDADLPNIVYGTSLSTIAQLFAADHDLPAAYEHARRSVLFYPSSPTAQDAFAYDAIMTGHPDEAIEAWKAAVALDPSNAGYKHNLELAQSQTQAGRQGG